MLVTAAEQRLAGLDIMAFDQAQRGDHQMSARRLMTKRVKMP